MDGYFVKPLEMNMLRNVLERLLGVKLAGREGKPVVSSADLPPGDMLDEQRLRELTEILDEEDFREMIAVFIADSNDILEQLSCAGEKDLDEISALSHKLKSSSSNIGVLHVFALSKAIEAEAKNGSLENYHESIAQLRAVVSNALKALEQRFLAE